MIARFLKSLGSMMIGVVLGLVLFIALGDAFGHAQRRGDYPGDGRPRSHYPAPRFA